MATSTSKSPSQPENVPLQAIEAEIAETASTPKRNSSFRLLRIAIFLVFLLLPLYLIVIGIWKLNDCEGGTESLPIWVLFLGIAMAIFAMFIPGYKEQTTTPSWQSRIFNIALTCLIATLTAIAVYTYRMESERNGNGNGQCAPIIYQTAVVISVAYCISICLLVIFSLFVFCKYVVCPMCEQ